MKPEFWLEQTMITYELRFIKWQQNQCGLNCLVSGLLHFCFKVSHWNHPSENLTLMNEFEIEPLFPWRCYRLKRKRKPVTYSKVPLPGLICLGFKVSRITGKTQHCCFYWGKTWFLQKELVNSFFWLCSKALKHFLENQLVEKIHILLIWCVTILKIS